MKKNLIFLIFMAFIPCLAQEPQKGLLIDEWDRTTCDSERSRIDILFQSIIDLPGSTGYAVFYPKHDDVFGRIYFLSSIINHAAFRRFPAERVVALIGPIQDTYNHKLWVVPAGAESPQFPILHWTIGSEFKKPALFYASLAEGDCAYDGEKAFFEVIAANPRMRGNVVIKATSLSKYGKAKKSLLDQNKNAKEHLRFYFVKDTFESFELWLLPQRKGE